MSDSDRTRQPTSSRQRVDNSISPIYVPLEPAWADSETMHEPLMARGCFSNAWVMYDDSELPPDVGRPTAMTGQADDDPRPQNRQPRQK